MSSEPLLRLAGSDEKPAEEPFAPDRPAGAALAVPLQGGQMTRGAHAWAATRMIAREGRERARDLSRRKGSIIYDACHGTAPSIAEHAEYGRSRAWVPPGHEGGVADRSGTAYHAVIGGPLLAFFLACIWVVVRPLRFLIAIGTAWAATVAVLLATGETFTAMVLITVACVAGAAWFLATKPRPRKTPGEDR